MRARLTHCKRGHPFVGDNIYVIPKNGSRTCRICRRARSELYNNNRPMEKKEEARRRKLQRDYGLSECDYQKMHDKQGGVCAICKKAETGGRRLSVDHDHVTGDVRSLLCRRCNTSLGNFSDDEDLLLRAVQYIKEWKEARI